MRQAMRCRLIVLAFACCLPAVCFALNLQSPKVVRVVPISPASPETVTLTPLKDPATVDQIREYLRLSGELEAYRARWTAALDKQRSIGVHQYWPEAFWASVKNEMQKEDLVPMYITLYQHGISRDLMQNVLDTYHTVGATLFKLSPACYKFTLAEFTMKDDAKQLTLAKTLEVMGRVYPVYKPQIKAASDRYLADHPNPVNK
jgi:hypothetical protein